MPCTAILAGAQRIIRNIRIPGNETVYYRILLLSDIPTFFSWRRKKNNLKIFNFQIKNFTFVTGLNYIIFHDNRVLYSVYK